MIVLPVAGLGRWRMSIRPKWFNQTVRAWLYGVGVAVGAVAVFYGLMTSEEVAVWLGLLAAIMGGSAATHIGERGIDDTTV